MHEVCTEEGAEVRHAIQEELRNWLLPKLRNVAKKMLGLDDCKLCLGFRGNTPGNENVYGGVIMCDDCHCIAREASQRQRTTGW